MACACGGYHTITLSNDGTAHSIGKNNGGQLGLGHNDNVSLPIPIPNLPKINMTLVVGISQFVWIMKVLFGLSVKIIIVNSDFNVPQKLQDIPPVLSVSCGSYHTLIITNDSNLWSCGRNSEAQLCHGDKEYRSIPQKTSFSNISKISAGYLHSLFENNKGEIFGCGNNQHGQCGLGHFKKFQITPSLILNLPSNIAQFICGYGNSLFLDSEGYVFSVGDNYFGQLGLGHNRNQNELNKIPDIPPIKKISCMRSSSCLVDFEGNLWTFGLNNYRQLGHGTSSHKNIPKIVNNLKDIQQISHGCGHHFLAKNSQNQIFATGNNDCGQLGTGDRKSVSIPKEINSQYSTIWRDEFHSRAKSARK